MRSVKHDVAIVIRGAPCREKTHIDDSACDDAEKRVFTPQLKRHNENARDIRPHRAPFEGGLGIYNEPCDYDGRDDRTVEFDGRGDITTASGKKKEWQRPQSKCHHPSDGDYSRGV